MRYYYVNCFFFYENEQIKAVSSCSEEIVALDNIELNQQGALQLSLDEVGELCHASNPPNNRKLVGITCF